MSDNFEMLVDVDATAQEAEDVCPAVLGHFRTLGLITGEANRECVLGGKGYRPGAAVAALYKLQKREYPFWELLTCGVEPQVGRGFNDLALGEVCEGFCCPSCAAEIEPFGEAFGDAVSKAIREWEDGSGWARVPCPNCRKTRPITEWPCKPPLGFGNLSFRFWNWPPLNSPAWAIDIAGIVRDVSGHTIVRTYGRF